MSLCTCMSRKSLYLKAFIMDQWKNSSHITSLTRCLRGPDPNEVQKAKELCLSLLENVREQYHRFKENPPQRAGFGYDRQQPPTPSNPYGGYGQQSSGYGSSSYGQSQSPTTPSAPPGTSGTSGPPGVSSPGAAATDYAAQYAQYYGGQDPYAAYGGYQNYVAYYQQYYAQQQAQQQGQGTPGAQSAQGEDAPPPPPSGSPPNGGYNSVGLSTFPLHLTLMN